jgi:hypothetical protein
MHGVVSPHEHKMREEKWRLLLLSGCIEDINMEVTSQLVAVSESSFIWTIINLVIIIKAIATCNHTGYRLFTTMCICILTTPTRKDFIRLPHATSRQLNSSSKKLNMMTA